MSGAKPKRGKPKRGKRRIWRRVAFWSTVFVLVVSLAGMGGFFVLYATTELPDPNADFQTNTTFITYADGETQLGSLAVQNRQTLEYDQIPQVMKDAVIAAEDRSFWENPGFSAAGIARAAWSIASGGEMQGGSTITQQYIKILYLDSGRTLKRKVRELMLAIKMGREMPKEEVLAGYLNTIYFGRGAYGVQAAAKSYFLKEAKDLSVAEAAALAAILNNPAGFNPSGGEANREKLLARYQYVLDGMLEMGTISQQDYQAARSQLPEFPEVPVNDRYGGTKGYLIKMVEEEMESLGFAGEQIHGGGLRIVTTIDKTMQEQAVKVAQSSTKRAAEDGEDGAKAEDLHVAIASIDTATGGIRALYGGADYVKNSRNWATTPRAAASTFKTFAVIAALRQGFVLNDRFNGDTFLPDGDTTKIHNQANEEYGSVSLRKALAKSINTAFVDLTQQMDDGPEAIVKAANDAGVPEAQGWDRHNRIALGFAEVSPVNLANAYATLANEGKRNEAHIVAKVTDAHGNVLYEAEPSQTATIEPDVAATVVDALTSVVDEGTGASAAELGRPVAGKTGTNGIDEQITSAWFVGMTKQLSTAVMYVAGDGGTADLVPYRVPGDRTFYGSGYPLMTWLEYMQEAVKGMPEEDFAATSESTSTKTATAQPQDQTKSPTPSATPTPTSEPSVSSETPSATPSVEQTPEPEPSSTEPEQSQSEQSSPAPEPSQGQTVAPTSGTTQQAKPSQGPTQPPG